MNQSYPAHRERPLKGFVAGRASAHKTLLHMENHGLVWRQWLEYKFCFMVIATHIATFQAITSIKKVKT